MVVMLCWLLLVLRFGYVMFQNDVGYDVWVVLGFMDVIVVVLFCDVVTDIVRLRKLGFEICLAAAVKFCAPSSLF
jgi:hypothetical protein